MKVEGKKNNPPIEVTLALTGTEKEFNELITEIGKTFGDPAYELYEALYDLGFRPEDHNGD